MKRFGLKITANKSNLGMGTLTSKAVTFMTDITQYHSYSPFKIKKIALDK